jgi:hypothetical protein
MRKQYVVCWLEELAPLLIGQTPSDQLQKSETVSRKLATPGGR